MSNFFNNLPPQFKIFLPFVILGLLTTGLFSLVNPNHSENGQVNQAKPEKAAEQEKTTDEITVRINIRNENKKEEPLSDVKVNLIYLGEPISTDTDSEGYADIKIPKTNTVRVYLSKPGFKSKNYQIDPNINLPKDRNIFYYLKPEESNLRYNNTQSPQKISQATVQKWKGEKWEGIYNQYDTNENYPMVLHIEQVNNSLFTGKLHWPTFNNTFTEVSGEFVTEFGDDMEESKWEFLKDFKNNRNGTWLKFTETKILLGGNLDRGRLIILNGLYYAHIVTGEDRSMSGVFFVKKKDSEPMGKFSLK
ncbi:hypothetical protein [Nostoc sp.]|uniref:hypothetical protein n=1 Tax=Nostoc sp. TaxID=1180 RepID=UPI002FFA57C3